MFWDYAAGVYDIFANVINKKTHKTLCAVVAERILPRDEVLECACGTGMLSRVIAPRCKTLIAEDISENMLKKARKKCAQFQNATFRQGDILNLKHPAERFDVVVAANVIHLLDEPLRALHELDRVCRTGGRLIIPTYMNEKENGKTNGITSAIGKAGADFKREFTLSSYEQFFKDAGYTDAEYIWCPGKVPCAVAVLRKKA